jgi:hypothetical protein
MRKKQLATAIIAASLLLSTAPAFAVTAPGSAGSPSPRSTCFGTVWGVAVNVCTSEQSWFIPLAVNSGLHTVSLRGDSNGFMTCTLYAQTQTGGLTLGTTVTPPTGPFIDALSVTVPTSGSAFVWCNMLEGDDIWSVTYSH